MSGGGGFAAIAVGVGIGIATGGFGFAAEGALAEGALAEGALAEGVAGLGGAGLTAGELAAASGGGLAAGEAAGAIGSAIGSDLVAGDVAGTVAGDTVAASGPSVTSSAAAAPGATDTASNVAGKFAAVDGAPATAGTNAVPNQFLSGAAEDAGIQTGNAANFAQASGSLPGAAGEIGAGKSGVMSFVDWMKANPQFAASGVQTVGGALGGMGKASVDRGTMERKAELDLQNKQAYAKYLRDASTNNAYTGLIGSAPSGDANLRRPDGSLVYKPQSGIINSGRFQ